MAYNGTQRKGQSLGESCLQLRDKQHSEEFLDLWMPKPDIRMIALLVEEVRKHLRAYQNVVHPKDENQIGTFVLNALTDVRCALVHRYDPSPFYGKRMLATDTDHALEEKSTFLTSSLSACLRLIRPMPQSQAACPVWLQTTALSP